MVDSTIPSDPSAHIPRRGDELIDFTTVTPDGASIRSRDFHMRRNLALVFTHGVGCPNCRDLLAELIEQRGSAQAEAGEILAVVPGSQEEIAQLRDELGIPFPIAVDLNGSIHQRYGLASDNKLLAGIFVADRYGTIFKESIAGGTSSHPELAAGDIPGWLEFIACRCT